MFIITITEDNEYHSIAVCNTQEEAKEKAREHLFSLMGELGFEEDQKGWSLKKLAEYAVKEFDGIIKKEDNNIYISIDERLSIDIQEVELNKFYGIIN